MILVYLMIFIYCQASMLNRTCFFLLGASGTPLITRSYLCGVHVIISLKLETLGLLAIDFLKIGSLQPRSLTASS